jgi:hypothetical protein
MSFTFTLSLNNKKVLVKWRSISGFRYFRKEERIIKKSYYIKNLDRLTTEIRGHEEGISSNRW